MTEHWPHPDQQHLIDPLDCTAPAGSWLEPYAGPDTLSDDDAWRSVGVDIDGTPNGWGDQWPPTTGEVD